MAAASTAATSNVSAATSSTALFTAGFAAVKGRTVYNDSTAVLYLKFGTSASTTSYTVQIPAGGYYEFPGGPNGVYGGAVEGVWAAANGSARCTEVS